MQELIYNIAIRCKAHYKPHNTIKTQETKMMYLSNFPKEIKQVHLFNQKGPGASECDAMIQTTESL
jgi:hypothetical protein